MPGAISFSLFKYAKQKYQTNLLTFMYLLRYFLHVIFSTGLDIKYKISTLTQSISIIYFLHYTQLENK